LDNAQLQLIRSYFEKGRAKLAVARELLASGHFDDAVSRAYYAAFHSAQAALLAEGQKPETHRGVVTLFGLLLVQTGKIDRRFGRILSNLKDDRETSDYEAVSYIDEQTARDSVAEAEAFCAEIERHSGQSRSSTEPYRHPRSHR